MHKVGLYAGSFNPVHLGHVMVMVKARTMCEKLYVILSYNDHEKIDYRERVMWLKNITADMENVFVLAVYDDCCSKKDYDWVQGNKDIRNKINEKIDIIFCGDDYKDNEIFKKLWSDTEIYYVSRDLVPISSTLIRKNPFKYYDYLPNEVRSYFNKKVVIVGTESCGKSTLVKHLAKIYNTNYVNEVGRDVCDRAGGIDNMQTKHYFEILVRHVNEINEKIRLSNKVLFIDTESLITLYYYKLGFLESDDYNSNIDALAKIIYETSSYDLWIFLEPDVDWVQDGTRTYGDETVRLQNNQNLKKLLKEMGVTYYEVAGNYHNRLQSSMELIDKFIMGE